MTLAANMGGRLRGFVKPIHRKYRDQKVELFLRLVRGRGKRGRLLDVGGGPGVDGEYQELYATFDEVVVLNLELAKFRTPPGVKLKTMAGDARELPLESSSFDWVFSNAVIEHVGGWQHQERFAKEIQRVAAHGYFVTTPNKYFPIEPHAMLPFYQFLPVFVQKKVAPYSPGYLREYEEINLLSAGQMRKLFPGATVLPVGFPVLGNSLVAYSCGEQNGHA